MRVYFTSPWIPAEWIKAHGLEPRGIWAAEEFCLDALALSAGVCGFAEAAVLFAQERVDSAVVFAASCDQLRRGFDAATVSGPARLFLFNLPATQNPNAKQIYRSELERLGQFLLEQGGQAPAPANLRREMHHADLTRKRLLETAPSRPARSFAEAAAKFHRDGSCSTAGPRTLEELVPLALIGGPLCATQFQLLDVIEAAGGRVALNGAETGERSLTPSFEWDGNHDDPFTVLADGYFKNIVDVFQRPNAQLYSWMKSRLGVRRVRGIILWQYTGCDLWRAETETLRESFGLPVLTLEAGTEAKPSAREVNRIQAFLETLK